MVSSESTPFAVQELVFYQYQGLPNTGITSILVAVSDYTGVPVHEITGKDQHREIVFARQLVCYFAKQRTILSLKKIGGVLGGRDHTTVLNALKKINGYIDVKDYQVCLAVTDIEERLKRFAA